MYPVSTGGDGRRDRGADRLLGHDPVRPGACAGLRRRAVRGHLPGQGGGTLSCTITNTQLFSTVRVVKQWVGPASSATIFVDQNGTAPFDASRVATANGDSVSFDYPLSTGAFVGETAVPTNYTATIQCGTAAPAPYTGGPFAVTAPATAGAVLICTIKNSIIPATVRVEKQWDGAPASTTIFVDQNGTAPFDASVVADLRR